MQARLTFLMQQAAGTGQPEREISTSGFGLGLAGVTSSDERAKGEELKSKSLDYDRKGNMRRALEIV